MIPFTIVVLIFIACYVRVFTAVSGLRRKQQEIGNLVDTNRSDIEELFRMVRVRCDVKDETLHV